jgi:amino acid transporter
VGLISAAGMLNALLCTSARVPFAMAERGMLPKSLRRLHARHATPWLAILINSVGVSLLIPFSFQELIEVDMCLYAAALILEFAALIRLRIKNPEMERPFRIPFATTGVVALSIPPIALCLASIALSNDTTKYVSLGGIGVGLIVFRWHSRTVPSANRVKAAPTV